MAIENIVGKGTFAHIWFNSIQRWHVCLDCHSFSSHFVLADLVLMGTCKLHTSMVFYLLLLQSVQHGALNQVWVYTVETQKFEIVGTIFTSPNHPKCQYICTSADSDL